MSKFKRFLHIFREYSQLIICWSVLYVFIKDYVKQGEADIAMDKITKKFTADNVEKLLNDSGVKLMNLRRMRESCRVS